MRSMIFFNTKLVRTDIHHLCIIYSVLLTFRFSPLCHKYLLGYIYILITNSNLWNYLFPPIHTESVRTDMHHLYLYNMICHMQCFACTFHFSPMSQIISEIYIRFANSNLWDQLFFHTKLYRMDMYRLYYM